MSEKTLHSIIKKINAEIDAALEEITGDSDEEATQRAALRLMRRHRIGVERWNAAEPDKRRELMVNAMFYVIQNFILVAVQNLTQDKQKRAVAMSRMMKNTIDKALQAGIVELPHHAQPDMNIDPHPALIGPDGRPIRRQ